jgi:DNA-binding transcriptional ArsR family regulator
MSSEIVELTQALADPLRLSMLQHLMGSAATVSELQTATGASQSNASNHLAILRERGLVRATRQGRQMVYELRDASVGQLVESLSLVAGAAPAAERKSPPLAGARTCYDHLAGKLGVAIFDALATRDAIQALGGRAPLATMPVPGPVEIGPAGTEIFSGLGIDVDTVRRERRRFAATCLDWTERRPHLSGALGAALWARALERGWVVRQPGSRAVIVTDIGRRELGERLGLAFEPTEETVA